MFAPLHRYKFPIQAAPTEYARTGIGLWMLEVATPHRRIVTREKTLEAAVRRRNLVFLIRSGEATVKT